MQTALTFLGTNACIPEVDNDTASYLVNDEILIDTGWHVTQTLRRAGKKPCDIKALLFTHLHHDHMMALSAFLYERYCAGDAHLLQIFGSQALTEAVANADRYLQKEIYWPDAKGPQLRVISGGERFDCGGFSVETMPSVHAVPGLCYCMRDTAAGTVLGFPGDGELQSEQIGFFRGCDVLTHEFSLGLSRQSGHHTRHSSIWDAARLAQDCGAAMLCPVHGPAEIKEECAQELAVIYKGDLHWPEPNERLLIGRK